MTVHLKPIDGENWRQALQISPAPEQAELVTEYEPVALLILAKAYIGDGDLTWEPTAIFAGDTMVGVVAIAHSNFECQVHHFLIDRSFQGQGYGKAAMLAIIDHIRKTHPDCGELTLTANPKNQSAQHVYKSVGFVPTGKERVGGPIWRFDVTKGVRTD